MGNKQDFSALSNRIQGSQTEMKNQLLPQWQKYGSDVSGFRTNALTPFRQGLEAERQKPREMMTQAKDYYTGQLTNGGPAAGTVANMRGTMQDAASGARSQYMKDMGRNVAAMGLGNTGASLRNLRNYDVGYAANQRAAVRDVDTWAAEQKRAAAEAAAAGLTGLQGQENQYNLANLGMQQQGLGMEGDTYNLEGQGIAGQQGVYDSANQMYQTDLAALQQKNKPGFWGNLASSFAQGMGSGLSSWMSPQGVAAVRR